MIISLYAGGMTLRDIQHHLVSTIGTELSHETISKITDQVAEEVLTAAAPLEALYPVIYLDALVVKVKDAAHVRNKPPTLPSGWMWTASNTCSASGCKHLRRKVLPGCAPAPRGIKDVLIVCCDGLTGFPEAIEATWPNSTVQTCVVHLIRAAMRFVNWRDRKNVAAALKPIYQAADADARSSSWRRSRPPS